MNEDITRKKIIDKNPKKQTRFNLIYSDERRRKNTINKHWLIFHECGITDELNSQLNFDYFWINQSQDKKKTFNYIVPIPFSIIMEKCSMNVYINGNSFQQWINADEANRLLH